MIDLLEEIYQVLKNDDLIKKHVNVKSHITFNYPEVEKIDEPRIVLDEVDDPLPREYGDNDNLALSYLVQVDVYTKVKPRVNARKLRDELSYHISRLLKDQLNLTNTSNAKPEYDDEFRLYRSSRRYEGTFYRRND